MPFLLPALVALTSDAIVVLFLGRQGPQRGKPIYEEEDKQGCKYSTHSIIVEAARVAAHAEATSRSYDSLVSEFFSSFFRRPLLILRGVPSSVPVVPGHGENYPAAASAPVSFLHGYGAPLSRPVPGIVLGIARGYTRTDAIPVAVQSRKHRGVLAGRRFDH